MPVDALYLTGDLELFAQWAPVEEGEYVTITFHPGSGGEWMPGYTGPRPVVVYLVPGEEYTFPHANALGIDRRWWNFGGWQDTQVDYRYFLEHYYQQITEDQEFRALWYIEG